MRICTYLTAFLILTACNASETKPDFEGISLEVDSDKEIKSIKLSAMNNSNQVYCYSSAFVDERFLPNPLKVLSSNGEYFEVAIDNFGGETQAPQAVMIQPGEKVQIEVDATPHFEFEKASWVEFDASIPFFPCSLQGAPSTSREHEEVYGPGYLHKEGLRFVTTEKFRVEL